MSNSPNLSIPYIQPSQAQKHITHNLAIELLDALVHLSLTTLDATTPPADPFEGQVVAVGSGATGIFEGEDGKIAYRSNGAWLFVPPRNGFKAWVESRGAFYVFQDSSWRLLLAVGADTADGLGLNASWDAENRLSVASSGTLLSHEGAGHRLKINKSAAPETASLLFQTGFSGRAEMGIAGDDDFSIKVSADGESWATALRVDGSSGETSMDRLSAAAITGEAVQASPEDTTPGRLMRADWGYGPGNVVGPVSMANGHPSGAVVESAHNVNDSYTRFADGTQIVSLRLTSHTSGQRTYNLPQAFSEVPYVIGTAHEASPRVVVVNKITVNSVTFDAWTLSGSRISTNVNLCLFGRWG
ncbi:DUF2793 domain-containing protein [Palleronia sp. LCG004]|uniref:DUF2793 domain-containing protein n=1 Tax=Palleronia sp. LCG004 TaxID=3079304 RepID=UPI002942DE5A|nr:DUF2793 domain-containing protein [Palleronia sp. LCG004]WOI58444.1 DUF2793 domain-containing protein [Palleronia sp. LCG004]